MRLRDYFITIAKALNPNSFKEFAKEPLKPAFKYFFFLMIVCTVVFFVLLMFQMMNLSNSLGSKLDNFETFNITTDVDLKVPFYLMKSPKVLVDFNKTNLTEEQMLINEDEVIYNKYIFFGERRIDIHSFENILDNKSSVQNLLPILGFFILPSILVWAFVFFSLKFLIYILLAALIGLLVTKAKHKYHQLMKIGLYASTLALILELAILPVYRILWWITLAIFLIYFIIGVWITSKTEFASKKNKKPDFRPKKH